MDSVVVLMSTYNGENYLRRQIESILKQKGVEVTLIVRDDGSNDSTKDILYSYNNSYKITIIEGANIGAARSFFELIRIAPNSNYYAFADQDDVWDEDKLCIAVKHIKDYSHMPCVYSSNTRLVDKELKLIKVENDNPLISVESAFIKNYCTGCTTVFNDRLIQELKIYQPVYVVMHDWWVNLIALSIGGKSIYDHEAHMDYRQHGKNVSGAEVTYFRKCINRARKFFNTRYRRDIMARQILDNYEKSIPDSHKETLQYIANNNWKMLYKPGFRSRKKIDTILFKICVLFNKI